MRLERRPRDREGRLVFNRTLPFCVSNQTLVISAENNEFNRRLTGPLTGWKQAVVLRFEAISDKLYFQSRHLIFQVDLSQTAPQTT